ncbi:GNAT family N-acetyltransferase [Lusitaniella coriacea LEGE 07157]|uniref:GNAT family N-acetyltransferase n=1 Tax=Lusitaniella coriacea LEGE 07157 TaxID=945747 RepID=A0A8J7DLI6_9CYAN|nr:GNAT family N-acetyltransferase [Lusitaniella coriacea]MBE9115148.1 GNAT family N-acetyltransferase [Lusitaniella coriacea LEGE 07157]
MDSQIEFNSINDPEDDRRLGEILAQAFHASPDYWSDYRDRVGVENFRVLRRGGSILGGLAIYNMGQWWCGNAVPMAGVAAVGISPENRGTGVALELMTRTLQELYDREIPLSALYPAVQRLYRKVGYERAGTYCQWEVPLASLLGRDPAGVGFAARTLSVQPVDPASEILRDLYRQQACRNNGNLDRHPGIWQNIVQSDSNTVYAYTIGSEGYLIYTQESKQGTSYLSLRDWVATTPSVLRSLLTFLADHRSQIDTVRWFGSIQDPLAFLLPEQTAKIRQLQWWMLRLIRVDLALAQRGYPMGVENELHLSVRDDLLDGNNGNFILSISGGKGEVRRGGRGDLQLDSGGLALLYSGLVDPSQLQRMGLIERNDHAIAAATSIFVGSEPFLMDFF